MDPDPARRPRSIGELRDLLGIVPLGPAVAPAVEPAIDAAVASHMSKANNANPVTDDAPHRVADLGPRTAPAPGAAGAPSFLPGGARPRRRLSPSLNRWQRWAVAAGGGAILIALALAMFAEMRDSGAFDHIVLTLPQQGDGPRGQDKVTTTAGMQPGTAYGGNTGADATAGAPGLPASAPPDMAPTGTSADGAAASATVPSPAMASATPAPTPAAATPAPEGRLPGVAVTPNGNLYKLRIRPWGVVYVDGVDRGVSPPVKRLALAPGRHTIRITNPNFHDRVLEVDTARGDGQISVDFNEAPR
jgi:hypothetical protein